MTHEQDQYLRWSIQKMIEEARIELRLAKPYNADWRFAAIAKQAWKGKL